ncbi:MAG TPA: ATP-binding protein [Longimicrobiales bacterium]|nr:ATP-binding protein [Longimicrobiales bacterium]
MRFLADASQELASSLDFERTVREVARLAVPFVADWCAVDLVDEHGATRRLAVEHSEPAGIERLRDIEARYPGGERGERGVSGVIRSGRTEWMAEIPESLLAGATDDRFASIVRELGLRSYIIAPLTARGRTLGALGVAYAESGRRYGADDVPFVEDLACRAGVAIDNARLVAELEQARARLEEQATTLAANTEALGAQRTELREAAEARLGVLRDLRAERARLAAVVENAPVGLVIVAAPSGRLVLGNAAAERILRRPLPIDSLPGRDEWKAYDADGRSVPADEFVLARVLATGESAGPDERLLDRSDGTRGWVRITGAPIRDATGGLRAALLVLDDIDAERRAAAEREALLQEVRAQRHRLVEVFRQAPALLAVLRGPDHVFDFMNPKYEQLIRGRDVVGKPVREALPELVDQGLVDLLDRVYETGKPYHGREVRVRLRPARGAPPEDRYLNFVYQPLCELDESISGIIVHGVDVTDQVRARHEAEAANRAKSDFLATMSHELRTPLNAMIGYTDLLLQGLPQPIPEEDRRSVERIGLSAHHLLELIEEILTFSRLEAQREIVEPEEVDVQRLLDEVTAITEPLAAKKGLRFRADTPEQPLVVEMDPRKVRQILLNLVGNAVKFTERGEVVVAVRREGDDVVFQVRDTGIGIPADHLEKIFEPFWQAETQRTRRVGGAGLGLSVTRRLARLMGGDVTVTSELGRGSTFTVRLPLRPPTFAAAA